MPNFDCFVLFAEMRTGSNFLETNLNSFAGIKCHGELFNPHFIAYPGTHDVMGITQAMRDADPARLLGTIRLETGVLSGFRFFHDHDPRVLELILPDPRCAKIILTRNPIESYVSRKIAAATGQWKLTNARNAKSDRVRFDPAEFEAHLTALQAFQLQILGALQRTGQTAFYLDYEDLQDVEVMNGLAAFLGVADRIEDLDRKLKKQNPEPIEEKVVNFPEMEAVLARLDRFNLARTPNFEPRRGAAIPSYLAAATSPFLYLPVPGGPVAAMRDWLHRLDGAPPEGDFTMRSLRQWKLAHPGHRSFSVLRHPLVRAHAAYRARIAGDGPGVLRGIRDTLARTMGLQLPDEPDDHAGHRAAFEVFLGFLKANLGGQTNLRVDPVWASQAALLQGMGGFALPDAILREERLSDDLPMLLAQIGLKTPCPPMPQTDPEHERLAAIHRPQQDALIREVYLRDYIAFGFDDWRPAQAA
ncbi:MAG: nodulation protein NodH [Rubellimicrobium sp.]|nr:nodulation protein NodH [Rubellimicrobium sp.]